MIGGDAVIFKPTANNNEQVLEYNITERDPNFKPYPTQVISQASGHQENGVTTLIFTRPLAPAGKHVSGLSHERCASLCAVWPECALCAHVCTCVRVCILCVHSCACTYAYACVCMRMCVGLPVLCERVCVFLCLAAHVCACMCVLAYVVRLCVLAHVFACVRVCMFVRMRALYRAANRMHDTDLCQMQTLTHPHPPPSCAIRASPKRVPPL